MITKVYHLGIIDYDYKRFSDMLSTNKLVCKETTVQLVSPKRLKNDIIKIPTGCYEFTIFCAFSLTAYKIINLFV